MSTRKRNSLALLFILAVITTCTAIVGIERLLPGRLNEYAILAGAIGGSMVAAFGVWAILLKK